MPVSGIEDPRDKPVRTSRLGASLMRLHGLAKVENREDSQPDNLFAQWQQQWSGRRDQIASRLQIIESRLQDLSPDNPRPRLNLVGIPLEDEAATA